MNAIFWLMGFASAWIIALTPNKELYLASGNLWYIAYYSICLVAGWLGITLTGLLIIEWIRLKLRNMIWKI